MLGIRAMQLRAPNRLWSAALIAGCVVLVSGCATVRKSISPLEQFPWATEMGAAQAGSTTLPAEAAAMGHFLTAEVALNQGDHDTAMKEYEAAVATDPASPLLRQRLAMLYVRANRL